MTVKQTISTYSKKVKSSSPLLDAEVLLCKILNKPKEYLYTYPNKELNVKQLNNFTILFKRRQKGEPIAYLLGHQEFYGLAFKVNKNVLIPRPETELLVQEVISYCSKLNTCHSILDIGVGSGAIIISLAKNIKNARFFGTDISTKALTIAKQNAKIQKVKIRFFKGNLLQPLFHTSAIQFDNSIITANLPYLDKKEKNLLPSSDIRGLKFEPKIAWDGGADGLKYYREFFGQLQTHSIKPQAIFLEIGYNQAKAIKNLIPPALGSYSMQVKKDLCGFDRLIIISK